MCGEVLGQELGEYGSVNAGDRRQSEEVTVSSAAGVMGRWELSYVGAGNRVHVFCILGHLSSP